MKIIQIPIKKIITGEIQEFEFIRNNPIASTVGAGVIGGAIAHDYHANGHKSVGEYVGSKMDAAKNLVGSGLNKAKEATHDLTKPEIKSDEISHPNDTY